VDLGPCGWSLCFLSIDRVSKGIRGLPERRRGRRDPLFDVPNFHDMFEVVKDTSGIFVVDGVLRKSHRCRTS
jgi:hypothetical protein